MTEEIPKEAISEIGEEVAKKYIQRKRPTYTITKKNYMVVRVDLNTPHEAVGFLEEAKRVVIDGIIIQRRLIAEQAQKNQIQIVKNQSIMDKLKTMNFLKGKK